MRKGLYIIALLGCLGLVFNCTRPKSEPDANRISPQAQYKEIKPLEYDIPQELNSALPGLLNDKIRVWKEISPTINLVAEIKDYSLGKAINYSAEAFLVLLAHPEFQEGIEFWIIQVQPSKGGEVLVWGVKPEEVKKYKEDGQLKSFFSESEYVLINDQIIEKGEPRIKHFNLAQPE